MSNVKVVVYSTDWCPPCKSAKAFLKANNIPFTSYDVEKEPARLQEMLKLSKGKRGVPLIVVGDTVMQGYSEQWMRDALKKAGLLNA